MKHLKFEVIYPWFTQGHGEVKPGSSQLPPRACRGWCKGCDSILAGDIFHPCSVTFTLTLTVMALGRASAECCRDIPVTPIPGQLVVGGEG